MDLSLHRQSSSSPARRSFDVRLEPSAVICGHLRRSAFQPLILRLPYPRPSAFIRGQSVIALPVMRADLRL
jgi:hypothetical protein